MWLPNLVGRPLTEIIGRSDREFLDDPAQGEAVMANDARIMAEDRTQALEEGVTNEANFRFR